MGLLGLLALAGLITGLVLALNSKGDYGTPEQTNNTTQAQGIPPVSTFTPV